MESLIYEIEIEKLMSPFTTVSESLLANHNGKMVAHFMRDQVTRHVQEVSV
jgi:hypothetical protein